MRLIERINSTRINAGQLALFYLAQAGFCLKTSDEKIIIIDAYLSDACERMFGFKRMIPALIEAEEIDADLFLSTHSHADHLDPDSFPIIAKNRKTLFVGASDCEELYREKNLPVESYELLNEGEEKELLGVTLKGVYADHGDLAPDAIGMLIGIDGITIYHAGDTSFAPRQIKESLNSEVDIMIVPINGQYGNMNAEEACRLAAIIKPKILIASHFWMFLEHVSEDGKGDPATFLKESSKLPKGIRSMVMSPGEGLIYSRKDDLEY